MYSHRPTSENEVAFQSRAPPSDETDTFAWDRHRMAAHMKRPRSGGGLLLSVVLASTHTRAQTQSPARVIVGGESVADLGADQARLVYAHANPYMDDPLPELKRAVPALGGLKADPSQENLQSILDRTGEMLQAQVP